MARQPMACARLSDASSELLALLLRYVLELSRGILDKLVIPRWKEKIVHYGKSRMAVCLLLRAENEFAI